MEFESAFIVMTISYFLGVAMGKWKDSEEE